MKKKRAKRKAYLSASVRAGLIALAHGAMSRKADANNPAVLRAVAWIMQRAEPRKKAKP